MKLPKFLLLLSLAMILMSASCEGTSSDDSQKLKTEQSLNEANKQIGMPAIVNFQERKLFKAVLEARDQENLVTYCYLMNEMNGTVGQFLGKGIGYGIPASTQYTNPEKIAESYQGGYAIIPQADPNGLFMPSQTEATWYMLLDKDGTPRPVYIEPAVIVSPIPLK